MLLMQDYLHNGKELKDIEAKRRAMIHEGLRPRDEEDKYARAVRSEENIDNDDLRRVCKEYNNVGV